MQEFTERFGRDLGRVLSRQKNKVPDGIIKYGVPGIVLTRAWVVYWEKMKAYRDNLAAHHNESNKVANYPVLNLALESSFFYYKYLIKELRTLGETRYPDDLQAYCADFHLQAREVAARAIAATVTLRERAY